MEDNTTITTQHQKTTSAGKHEFASPSLASGQAICTSYIVGEAFGEEAPEFLNIVLNSENATGTLHLASVSGSGTGNYGVYETESGAVTGLYISRDTLGVDGDADPDDFPQEIPFSLAGATEEDFEEESEDTEMQDEAAGLLQ
ncbi:hypothetical protein M199_gp092 [Halogranum tailed virus 1]|uniref:Uncharacterized protein n=1 Tax=Halogranum tailed virus 1 TaxID=1273749 RepID=R4T760_9CAUD|nr:hypothetical protein M199_gp092 [Halogranum tailed virus 1]AGM11574.1 hypothetical protein HGTV1_277 [Halogranum tailed virus 1]